MIMTNPSSATTALAITLAVAGVAMLSYSPAAAEPPPTIADDVVCDQCVDSSDIAARAVNANRLGNNAVRTNKLRDGAVTSDKILDRTIMPEDLGYSPGPSILVDSTGTPVGVALSLDYTPSTVVSVTFEGGTFLLAATSSTLLPVSTGSVVFANTDCAEPGFLDQVDNAWSPLDFATGRRTSAGMELWVQDGPAVSGFIALSEFSYTDTTECKSTNGFPQITNSEVIPMRNTGIILPVEFPPPYDVINWPSLP